MTAYRAVVEHVRYWRGAIHRWSTSYTYYGSGSVSFSSSDAQSLLTQDDKMCFSTVSTDGGTSACNIYNQTAGGPPIATYVAFPWDTPADWIAYGGAAWSSKTGLAFEPVAEVALAVEWAGGLSKSGKPVIFRKWYHAVPASTGVGTAPDVATANVTSLTTQAQALVGVFGAKGLTLGSPTGRLAGSAKVLGFYGNHQMPRGRRRKALVTASGKYTGPTISYPIPGSGASLPQDE